MCVVDHEFKQVAQAGSWGMKGGGGVGGVVLIYRVQAGQLPPSPRLSASFSSPFFFHRG